MKIAPLSASLLAALALAAPAMAEDVSYQLNNDSALTLMEVYTSPANTEDWGPDILGAEVIAPGGSGTVTIADGSAECTYDIMFVMEDGQELIDTVDICQLASYTLQ